MSDADQPYQVMPSLDDDEYERLKHDIEKHGLEYPILVDPDGNVIDGHHRMKACRELGIDPKTEVVDGTDDENYHRAYRSNLLRRDLNGTKREVVKQYLLEHPERLEEDTQRDVALDLGVSQATVANAAKEIPDSVKPIKDNQLNTDEKRDRVQDYLEKNPGASNREAADTVDFDVSHVSISKWRKEWNQIDVIHSDFTEADIEPESVDHIITDPPYGENDLQPWTDLSAFADRVLKPGGFCIAYSGKYHLPDVMDRMGENLEYYWQMVVRHDGPGAKFFARNLRTNYKPILIYAKPPVEPQSDFVSDVIDGAGREKDDHDWQQAEAESAELLDRFTDVDNRICDPMAGSGTTAVACKRLDRRCVVIDSDADAIQTIRERVKS